MSHRNCINLWWGIGLFIAWCLLFAGCNNKSSKGSLFGATGQPLETVVVIPDGYDTPTLREKVSKALGAPMSILPQEEPLLSLMFVSEQNFSQMFKSMRNVLFLTIDSTQYTRPSVGVSRDVYASGQLLLHARAADLDGLYKLLDKRGDELGRIVHREELRRISMNFEKTYSSNVAKLVEETIDGYTINVTNNLEFTSVAEDFVWASDQGQKGRTDLLVYTYPYEGLESLEASRIIAARDSVLRRHVPGSFEGSYMVTEARIDPVVRAYKYGGNDGVELRGLWRMEGDMMGGPYVLHAFKDESNHRVVVSEVLVYNPGGKKKKLMLVAEAQLCTLRPINTSFDGIWATQSEEEANNEEVNAH